MTGDGLGSLAWGERTNGILSRYEAVRVALGCFGQGLTIFGSSALRALQLHGDLTQVAPCTMEPPDTPLGRAVEEIVATQPASMVRHVKRTAAFAFAIKEHHPRLPVPDLELLWCACMLHDIGFQDQVDNHCFAVRGGLLARSLAARVGVPPDRAQALGDAVSRHATPLIHRRQQPIAYLVAAGALADIFGLHLQQLDPASVRQLVTAQPRGDFSKLLATTWQGEADAVPRGRAAVADHLGFSWLAKCPPKLLR